MLVLPTDCKVEVSASTGLEHSIGKGRMAASGSAGPVQVGVHSCKPQQSAQAVQAAAHTHLARCVAHQANTSSAAPSPSRPPGPQGRPACIWPAASLCWPTWLLHPAPRLRCRAAAALSTAGCCRFVSGRVLPCNGGAKDSSQRRQRQQRRSGSAHRRRQLGGRARRLWSPEWLQIGTECKQKAATAPGAARQAARTCSCPVRRLSLPCARPQLARAFK